MGKIVIAHGYGMGAGEHWYAATGEEFAAEGHEVRIPNFPEPFAPEPGVWLKELEAAVGVRRLVRRCWWVTVWVG